MQRERNEHKNTPPKKCIDRKRERDEKILKIQGSKQKELKKEKIFFRSKKVSTDEKVLVVFLPSFSFPLLH